MLLVASITPYRLHTEGLTLTLAETKRMNIVEVIIIELTKNVNCLRKNISRLSAFP